MPKVTFYGPRARDWLKSYLSTGPKDCEIVKTLAKAEGFSKGELNRAKKLLGVKTQHLSSGIWLWGLPRINKEAVWKKQ